MDPVKTLLSLKTPLLAAALLSGGPAAQENDPECLSREQAAVVMRTLDVQIGAMRASVETLQENGENHDCSEQDSPVCRTILAAELGTKVRLDALISEQNAFERTQSDSCGIASQTHERALTALATELGTYLRGMIEDPSAFGNDSTALADTKFADGALNDRLVDFYEGVHGLRDEGLPQQALADFTGGFFGWERETPQTDTNWLFWGWFQMLDLGWPVPRDGNTTVATETVLTFLQTGEFPVGHDQDPPSDGMGLEEAAKAMAINDTIEQLEEIISLAITLEMASSDVDGPVVPSAERLGAAVLFRMFSREAARLMALEDAGLLQR